MRPKALILAALLLTAAGWMVASPGAVGGAGNVGVPESRVEARAVGGWRTFSSTVNGGTTYRVSRRGNVYSAESPTGIDHIDAGAPTEGYCLRYTPEGLPAVEAYDDANTQSGLGAASRSNSAPWRVTRTTSDGTLQLTQEFTFDGPAKELQVRMTVRNVSNAPVSSVSLIRVVDFDVDVGGASGFADPADNWVGLTEDSVLAWGDAVMYIDPHGMLLQVIREPGSSGGSARFDNSPTTCAAGAFIQGPHKGDDAGGVAVSLGTLEPGARRSATFRYARI